jgi:flagellar hook-length control protein FliK
MNDLRLPGLLGPGTSSARPEPASARGPSATDPLSFERALERSADARSNAEDARERNRLADRRDDRAEVPPGGAAAKRAGDADAMRPRGPQRSDGAAARDRLRAAADTDPAQHPRQPPAAKRPAASDGGADAAADPARSKDSAHVIVVDKQAAADGAPAAASALATDSGSNAPLPGAAAADLGTATLASAGAGSDASALDPRAAVPATVAATEASLASAAAAADGDTPAAARATLDPRAALPAALGAAGTNSPSAVPVADGEPKAAPDIASQAALDTGRLPSRDRLLEDFERRFESSLARAAGAHGSSPLNPAGPLAAAGLLPQPAPAAASMTVAYAGVTTPIGHPAFGNDLAHRVLILAGQRVQSAEISVTPGELGPIKVSIDLRGQEAAMQFSAAHATTRAAIEDALPRLREMLAAQGLQLTHANVSDQSQRDAGGTMGGQRHNGGDGRAENGALARRESMARTEAGSAQPAVARWIGLIDVRV